MKRPELLLLLAMVQPLSAQEPGHDTVGTQWTYDTPDARFRAEVVATGFMAPVAMSFLPDGRMLIADRPNGQLSVFDTATRAVRPIDGIPPVHGKIDGGLLDVVVHPDYAHNGWIYLVYAIELPEGNTTVVDRAHLSGDHLIDRQRLFTAHPVIANSNEFGARLLFDHGYLFVSLGQRNTPENSQDLGSDLGKILRLREDGTVPHDNPFVRQKGALPEIWSYGHRNPVGLAIDPTTDALWEHEHGPQGGDEINIIRRGLNYGWPVISYGVNYGGKPVGDGITHHAGMEQPVYYYDPDIAPSGMIFYSGSLFPRWRNTIFIGALSARHLNRLVVDSNRVMHEERLLADRRWRVRAVQQGPDGSIYLGVDGGMVVRITPVT